MNNITSVTSASSDTVGADVLRPTPQKPLVSGYGPATTAEEVIAGRDLRGKTAIVTGGYSGIGLETARILHRAGAKVIVPARDLDKANSALTRLDAVEVEAMDLMASASVDAFAKRFLVSDQPLHILVNSAGIMASPLVRDLRGYESQFSTNHLGHFQLVTRLWPALRKANGARVISVSSWGHRLSPVIFEDPNFQGRDYDRWLAYGQSKTANILFAVELDFRGKADGIRAFSLHPGAIVDTGLGKYLSREQLRAAGVIGESGKPVLDPARNLKTVEQGAATSVWCATSPQLDDVGGVYCQDCDIAPLVPKEIEADRNKDAIRRTASMPLGVMSYAVDRKSADRLWRLSEQLILG